MYDFSMLTGLSFPPNGAPQPLRGTGTRHGTESSSRGWLQVLLARLLCFNTISQQDHGRPLELDLAVNTERQGAEA